MDDVTPLRALAASPPGLDGCPVSGRPVQRRIEGSGGWRDGDAFLLRRKPAERRGRLVLSEVSASDRSENVDLGRANRRTPGASRGAPRKPASVRSATQLGKFSGRADDLREQVVATKDGGAIAGQERLREQTDYVYGAIVSTERAPTPYALARVAVLDHELADVEKSFAAFTASDLPVVNRKLKAKSLLRARFRRRRWPALRTYRAAATREMFGGIVGAEYRGAFPRSGTERER